MILWLSMVSRSTSERPEKPPSTFSRISLERNFVNISCAQRRRSRIGDVLESLEWVWERRVLLLSSKTGTLILVGVRAWSRVQYPFQPPEIVAAPPSPTKRIAHCVIEGSNEHPDTCL